MATVKEYMDRVVVSPQIGSFEKYISVSLGSEEHDAFYRITKPQKLVSEAMKCSLGKWLRVYSTVLQNRDIPIALHAIESCALCLMFNNSDNDYCDGCPIYEYTHERSCDLTPVIDAFDAIRCVGRFQNISTDFREYAIIQEIQFLLETASNANLISDEDKVFVNDVIRGR